MKIPRNMADVARHTRDPKGFVTAYAAYTASLLTTQVDAPKVARIIDSLAVAEKFGKDIYILGNGGSAALSSHWAIDLDKQPKPQGWHFRVHPLADNLAPITAYGNDRGYNRIFADQLENKVRGGDVVIAISASGNSPNLVEAVTLAKEYHATTIGVLGFDGGKLATICDIVHLGKTPKGEYGPAEDIHNLVMHAVCYFFAHTPKNSFLFGDALPHTYEHNGHGHD